MSGPKSIGYDVARLAAVRAEALAQLQVEVAGLRHRAGRLEADLRTASAEGLRDLPSVVRVDHLRGVEPAALSEAVTAARTALLRAEAELSRVLRAAGTAAALGALAKGTGGRSRSAADALAGVPRVATAAAPGGGQAAASRIARLLDRLPSEAPAAWRERVVAAAERAAETGAPLLVDELGLLVDRAAQAVRAAADARDALDAALGLPGLDEVRAALRQVEAGATQPDAQQWRDWRAAIDEARAASDRAYVIRTAADALAELGYVVGPDFATTLAQGWPAHAVAAGHDGYAARFRLDAAAALHVNVVRDVADASRDAEVEVGWCEDVAELREALAYAGVRTELQRAVPAGTAPVQRVTAVPRVGAASSASEPRRARRPAAAAERRPR